MSDYNEGDLVEVTSGDLLVRGRLALGGDGQLWIKAEFFVEPISYYFEMGWEVKVVKKAILPLPDEPGTIIAIGQWWLVKLRPYREGIPGAWEFLPVPESVAGSVKRAGQKTQCVYDNGWVQAEVEQEGGFKIISAPVGATG